MMAKVSDVGISITAVQPPSGHMKASTPAGSNSDKFESAIL